MPYSRFCLIEGRVPRDSRAAMAWDVRIDAPLKFRLVANSWFSIGRPTNLLIYPTLLGLCTPPQRIRHWQMDLQHLSPKIRTILTAPDVDLATISAKRVRKQLAAGGESEDFLKQRKADIDALIAQVYESVSSGAGAGSGQHANGSGGKPRPGTDSAYAAATPQKRKRSTSPANDAVPPSSQPQPLVHKKSKQLNGGPAPTKQLSADAELARQLSLELNGRSTRAGASGSGGSKPKTSKSNGKKAKRSKPTIDSDGEDGEGDEAKPKKARGGLGKEYILRYAGLLLVWVHPFLRVHEQLTYLTLAVNHSPTSPDMPYCRAPRQLRSSGNISRPTTYKIPMTNARSFVMQL